jgi:hypothetical protein
MWLVESGKWEIEERALMLSTSNSPLVIADIFGHANFWWEAAVFSSHSD